MSVGLWEIVPAAQKLEFLRELATTIGAPSDLYYFTAVTVRKKKQKSNVIVGNLNEAVNAHFRQMRCFTVSVSHMKVINADLVITIVREYLQFLEQEANHCLANVLL